MESKLTGALANDRPNTMLTMEGIRGMVVNPRLGLLYVVSANYNHVLIYNSCNAELVGQLELPFSAEINSISIDLSSHQLYLTDAAGANFIFVLDGDAKEQNIAKQLPAALPETPTPSIHVQPKPCTSMAEPCVFVTDGGSVYGC